MQSHLNHDVVLWVRGSHNTFAIREFVIPPDQSQRSLIVGMSSGNENPKAPAMPKTSAAELNVKVAEEICGECR